MSDSKKSWEKFLNPESLKSNLIYISLFITSFELFKDRVKELPLNFFAKEYDQNGPKESKKYKNEVKSRSNYLTEASLLWLAELGAIEKEDIDAYHKIRKHRNECVHDLNKFLAEVDKEFDANLFAELIELFAKIEKWWIVEIDIPTNPFHSSPRPTENDEVIPGSVIMLQLIHDIATGNEPEEGYYYEKFKEMNKNT
ncbi:MAG: hypothetical protein ACQETE_13545 [Bacteroidota bacterium]